MTLYNVLRIVESNNLPTDIRILSDSGWECSATDCDGVYYCEEKGCIVLTQDNENEYIISFIDDDRCYCKRLEESE